MSLTLTEQNVELIRQGLELLYGLPDETYSRGASDDPPAPAVGPHLRHCVDFYVCFLDGLDLRVVDYGARQRRPDLEVDRQMAIDALEAVAERLEALDPELVAEPLELRRESADPNDEVQWLGSTVGRELQFLSSHTIHHYALIALSLRLASHPVPAEFGVAPSTLEHWRREGRVAR